MRFPPRPLCAFLLAALLCGTVIAKHPVVPGFERFHAEELGNAPLAGRMLLGELNCTACHTASDQAAATLLVKQAPILDDVGARVRPEFLRAFIGSPHKTKPGTTMPHLFAGVDAEVKQRQVEALVHFLASTGELGESAALTPAVARGKTLFHTVGCVACHDSRMDGAKALATSVPLPDLESKYSVPSLAAFLANPLSVRPSGRMPHLNLTADESRDIASYLLEGLEFNAALEFAYYEGSWQKLPDFSKLTPKLTGKIASFDVNIGKPDHFAVVYKGLFRVNRDGKYRLHLGSDDGARMRLNGREIINTDGIHPVVRKHADVELKAGTHKIEVEYFEQGGGQELYVDYEGPGIKKQPLDYALTLSDEGDANDEDAFQLNPELAAEGQRLFQSIGCASCHQLRVEEQRLVSSRSAKPLAELTIDAGCLSAAPTASIPDYQLSTMQQQALRDAVNSLKGGQRVVEQNAERIKTTLTTFNCYACHQRGELGGVETARNAHFKSNQPEMGDEGRIPPHLDGVGAKLKQEWLRHVFNNGAKDRPYMFTRMPRFGNKNVGQLAELLGTADPQLPLAEYSQEIPANRLKAAGRHLAGAQGYSCVKCHVWGNTKATGIQSIDMTTMTQRLNENWFHHYLLDPQRFRKGTRMPAAWPQGQVLLPKVLDGQAMTQIHSVWAYLADGGKAQMPIGLGNKSIVLMPFDEPIVYRNFIEGAGTRAIGVGYPEKVNIAFDANDLRLAMIWHNAFIDASRHWTGRGQGFQGPLGDNLLKLPEGVSIAVLSDSEASWPTETAKQLGYRFSGYRLDKDRRPILRYRIGDTLIEDSIAPASSDEFTPLKRVISVQSDDAVRNLWYRAAVAPSIEKVGDDVYSIDDRWKIHVAGARIRNSGGNKELIVPLTAVIEQIYEW